MDGSSYKKGNVMEVMENNRLQTKHILTERCGICTHLTSIYFSKAQQRIDALQCVVHKNIFIKDHTE